MTATVTVTLTHGIKVGDDILRDAVLRELTAGDLIDAQFEAERLVETKDGPQLVVSAVAMGLAVLRRQVVSVGDLKGPLSISDLKKLSTADLGTLQHAADQFDAVFIGQLAGGAVAGRGRDEGVGAAV